MTSRESEAARIFLEAVEHHAPPQWPEYVEEAAAGDPDLVERVVALLRGHGQANPMLDPGRLLEGLPLGMPGPTAGMTIGQYKLLEQIGEGGMGLVFMAEQTQPVRRKVALKVLKPGMETRQVVARFEAERQALALMDHPHIAKVFDAGVSETGRPFFVMELVLGVPITQYCDERRLSARQRLEIFVTVCQAVQHAHQKGVIHRDLKPSNVLVSHHDTVAAPKIIDFGIAKATTQPLTERTLFTHFVQMIGTPLYMSPEQAEMNGLDVDTRSDVYSLGVMLYELLTGTTPFESDTLKRLGLDGMRRMIREEEPPRPSRRLSTLDAQACSTISERRGVDGRKLGQVLHGELDWIVMKSLEKDRDRRYESASAIAADVQRYLRDEAVEACPPSAGYRLRKYVRRNRTKVVACASAMAIVLVGLFSLAIGAYLVWREKEQTKLEYIRAQQNLDRAYQVLDELYLEQVGRRLVGQAQLSEADRKFLQRMASIYREFADENSSEPKARVKVAGAYQRIADIQFELEDFKSARAAGDHAVLILAGLAKELPHASNYRTELARAHNHRGMSVLQCGRLEEAQEAFLATKRVCDQALQDCPGDLSLTKLLASAHFYIGTTHFLAGDLAQAEQELRDAVSISKALLRSDAEGREYRIAYGVHCHTMCRVLIDLHQMDEADAIYRTMFALYDEPQGEVRVVDDDAARIAEIHNGMGLIALRRGQLDEAREHFQHALSLLTPYAEGMRNPPYDRRVQVEAYLGLAPNGLLPPDT